MNAVLVAALAGPAVLLIAYRTAHTTLRLRLVGVIAVSAAVGSLLGLALAFPPASAIVLVPLAVWGCAAAVVDVHEGRLPDVLTGPLLLITLLVGSFTDVAGGTTAISALSGGCVAVVMKAVVSAGFGWGDAKLVPTLAVVLVRHDAVVTGIVSIATLVAVTALLVGHRTADRTTLVPYGPALVLGTLGAAAL